MMNEAIVYEEPDLLFRYAQRVQDPHDGLSLFGPYDADSPSQPRSVSYGIVGTLRGIELFRRWAGLMVKGVSSAGKERLWPSFPGYQAAFCSVLPSDEVKSFVLDQERLAALTHRRDPSRRAYEVVSLYLEAVETISRSDDRPAVMICVVPDDVWLYCRAESRVTDGIGEAVSTAERRLRAAGQLALFETFPREQYQMSVDFRSQFKARAMEYDLPVQIVRESTLLLAGDDDEMGRGLTPLTDRIWNMATAMYYKAGGKPWKLADVREGVCYVGIAFRRVEEGGPSRTACCAAQMFLDTGDGIVFLGEYGPWYSAATEEFHLTRQASKKLLGGVIDTYHRQGGKELKEIFIHARSSISEDEFSGYREACPPGAKLFAVRVRVERSDIRCFRIGRMPVMRGTFWRTGDRGGYLWAAGFKPRLGTYDGADVPVPLRLDIQFGEGSIDQVSRDILGLTKLNYNACRLGDAQPVTIGFSDAVGQILVKNPSVSARRPNFKFYI